MKAKLFEFPIIDFEEVYAIIDYERHRLHISSVNYIFNLTLDLTRDLNEEIENQMKFGEMNFNSKAKKVAKEIIEELNLYPE